MEFKQTKTMCSILINCTEAQRPGFDNSMAAKSLTQNAEEMGTI